MSNKVQFEVPQVGETVLVTVPNHSPVLRSLFLNEPDNIVFEGTVLPGDGWLLPGEFNLSSDDKRYPIRTIQIKNVSNLVLKGKNGTHQYAVKQSAPAKTSDRTIVVPGSKAGTTYNVVVSSSGSGQCDCKGFSFRHRCAHIAVAMEIYQGKNTTAPPAQILESKSLKDKKLVKSNMLPAHIAVTTGGGQRKIDICKALINQYGNTLTSKQYIEKFSKDANLSLAGARTYFANLKKLIK